MTDLGTEFANLRRGVAVIPHSTVPGEIEENLAATAVAERLTQDDICTIDRLTRGGRGVRTLRFDWLPFLDDGGDGSGEEQPPDLREITCEQLVE